MGGNKSHSARSQCRNTTAAKASVAYVELWGRQCRNRTAGKASVTPMEFLGRLFHRGWHNNLSGGVSAFIEQAINLLAASASKAFSVMARPYSTMIVKASRTPSTQPRTANCLSFLARISDSRELIATVTRRVTWLPSCSTLLFMYFRFGKMARNVFEFEL